MKPGDRVRVIRGPHEGRLGAITDVSARRAAVNAILRPSDTKTALLKKLHIPVGSHAVQLDPALIIDGVAGRADSIEVIAEDDLSAIGGGANRKMSLQAFLEMIEGMARDGIHPVPSDALKLTAKIREALLLLRALSSPADEIERRGFAHLVLDFMYVEEA